MKLHTGKQGQSLRALRNANATALLAAVWNNGPISRSDLAGVTGLAPSSITRLARELERAGLIREVSKGRSSGGRLPTLLAVNSDAGLVAGIDLSGLHLRGGIVDATGSLLATMEQPFSGLGADPIREQLMALVASLLAHPAVNGRRLLGIGISVPGTVDTATGMLLDSTNLRLQNFPLRALLRERFGLPVFVEHDTAAAALAERYYGAGRGVSDLVYVIVSTGVGAGIVVADQVYRGEGGAAGELGHITVERDGQVCSCGKRGCLETVAAGPAIVASARRVLDQGSATLMAGWVESDPQRLTVDTVARAAEAGDRTAQEILNSAADYLAIGISTLACILDIRLVIVGGEVAQAGPVFFEPLHHSLSKYQLYSNVPRVVPAHLQQDAALKGVSMLTLQQVLNLVR